MQPVVYIDTSEIRDGKLEELKVSMNRLVEFVESKVPRLISYGFFLDRNERLMTVVAVHPDSASLAFHIDIGSAEFRKFADLINLIRIEVYGHVDEAVMSKLQQKSQMLGTGTVIVHEQYAGFMRWEPVLRPEG